MRVSIAIAAALAAAHAAGTAAHAASRVVLPANVTPTHYDVAIVPDAAHLAFAGSVKIDVDAKKADNTIKLNAADLAFGKVALDGAAASKVAYDAREETATLTFAKPFAAGHHVLAIDYKGKINQQAAGIFALDYDAGSAKKRALFTQFENSDARRFLPSWDEPNKKATFTLAATVPADQMAVANTPIVSTAPVGKGLKRVVFAASPKMSSYLLFFGLGDFERVSRKVNGVDIGIIVKRGDTDKAKYALDAASQILPYYEDYFGMKYPLPKLDLIGGPGQSQFFGAMENWGAIFYFERDLEIDAKVSTEEDRRDVYVVIAHEMAHQWFGDLVTMDWWEDLWLNEGFASWMELKSTDHFHPDWHVWLEALNAKENAMRVDARSGTHPIVTPILDVLQANQAFDTITYSKGQAVIRMLEDYTGADAFRAGVRNYMKAHAYGNTVTDDLWRELDKTSPRPVSAIAHEFTLQPGVPLIRAAVSPKGLKLTQDRFAMDASAKAPLTWHVPVAARAIGGAQVWHGAVARGAPVEPGIKTDVGVVVNDGQAGYFRTLYEPRLLKFVAGDFRKLTPENQLGLINDTRALGYTGDAPLDDFMSIAEQADPGMNPHIQDAIATKLAGIDYLYNGLPSQKGFRAFARQLLSPLFAKTGWDAKKGEDQNIALLRDTLLQALSQFDDPGVIAEARKRFAAYLKDPSHTSPDTRRSMLAIVARHADPAVWEQLHTLAKAEKNTLAKRELYELLGSALDDKLAERALALTLTDEAAVTVRPAIVASVSRDHPEMAFDFANGHLDRMNSWLEADSRNQFVPNLASNSTDPKMAGKVRDFASAHIPSTARGDAVKSQSSIEFNAQVKAKRLKDIDRWLAARHGE
ncbi:MAG: M1 family metallopeptidase [Alphaproteobacteria bacterium]|nr:M1 family metallopeptidase [Alphaproteobacteria bacterium]